MSLGELKLVKAITEIRYEIPVLFEDMPTINRLTKELKKQFTYAEYNPDLKVIGCFNQDRKAKCFVNRDNILIDIDQPDNLDYLKSVSNSVIPLILSLLDIELTKRIGIRVHYIYPQISTEESSQKTIVDYFINRNRKIVRDFYETDNFQPRISFVIPSEEGYKINVNVAYNQVGSAQMDTRGQLIDMVVNNTYPLTDLDLYTEIPKKPEQINGIMKYAITHLPEIASKVWSEE